MSLVAEPPTSAVKLLESLGEDERRTLSEAGDKLHLAAGKCLFQTGDPGGTLYIVETGAVELYLKDDAGQKIWLRTAESGDFFGEVSMLDGKSRSVNAAAVSDSELLALGCEDLFAVFRRNPETALRMLRDLGTSLRDGDKLLRARVARNPNKEIEKNESLLDRATDWVAWFSGSLYFLALTAVWFAVWIAVNTLPLGVSFFDPFPFGLLTMIVSLEAIFLATFVLISQNRQAEKDHLRSEIDYEINVKAEMEIAELHKKTDRINEQILELLARPKTASFK